VKYFVCWLTVLLYRKLQWYDWYVTPDEPCSTSIFRIKHCKYWYTISQTRVYDVWFLFPVCIWIFNITLKICKCVDWFRLVRLLFKERFVSLFGDLSVEKVSELNRIHIHEQCGNWSEGISYPHSRSYPLIGSFLLGFTYCDGRERESGRNIIFRCLIIGYFFPGLKLCQQGTCFYVWLLYKRERTPKHSAIWFILGALSITYLKFVLCQSIFFPVIRLFPNVDRCI
jgi:hypothetical protein